MLIHTIRINVQLPSSPVAFGSKLSAEASVQPGITSTSSQGVVCKPRSDQSFCSKTIHSESSALVPADATQSVLPDSTEHFLTNV